MGACRVRTWPASDEEEEEDELLDEEGVGEGGRFGPGPGAWAMVGVLSHSVGRVQAAKQKAHLLGRLIVCALWNCWMLEIQIAVW